MVGKLYHSPRRSLTRADLRKKNSYSKQIKQETQPSKTATVVEEMMGTSQRWHVLEEMGGTGP